MRRLVGKHNFRYLLFFDSNQDLESKSACDFVKELLVETDRPHLL